MYENETNYIAFHWSLDLGFDLLIIDNKIIYWKDDTYGNDQYPDSAFRLLEQMYSQEETRKYIPEKFHKYFKFISEQTQKNKLIHNFGYDQYSQLMLSIQVEMTKNEQFPIKITKIRRNSSRNDKNPEPNVKLTGEDAFINFSNLVVANTVNGILNVHGSQNVHKEKLIELMKKPIQYRIEKKDVNEFYCKYSIEYMQYILERVNRKEILPYEILKQSGQRILAALSEMELVKSFIQHCYYKLSEELESLSLNEIVLFYALIIVTDHIYGLEYRNEENESRELEYNYQLVEKIRNRVNELNNET